MDIGDWPIGGHRTELFRELRSLDLESNLAELEAFGFTVIEPGHLGVPDLVERTTEAVLALSQRRTGVAPDVLTGDTHRDMAHPLGQHMRFVLWEDPVFEELMLAPAMLGLVSWMLGTDCTLSLCNAMLKGPGENRIQWHTDEGQKGRPVYLDPPTTVNATYLLTDYSEAGGALAFRPGSHRAQREPTPSEAIDFSGAVPLVAPAGSWVIWGSHTWHASFPRSLPGLRGTVFYNFARWDLQTQEPYRATCTQEALDRNPLRFASLLDQFGPFPFAQADLDLAQVMRRGTDYMSLFDDEALKGTLPLRTPFPLEGR